MEYIMSDFKIINNSDEIKLSNDWVPVADLNNGSLVNEKGEPVNADYQGRKYKVIQKFERDFSCGQLFVRRLLAVAILICTLFFTCFSKTVMHLFNKTKEDIRFGIPHDHTITCTEKDQLYYIKPFFQFAHIKTTDNNDLNFAFIKTDKGERILPVTSTGDNKWKAYDGTFLEAFYLFAKDPSERPLSFILKKLDICGVEEKDLIKFFLDKDETNITRICKFNQKSTRDLLNFINENYVPRIHNANYKQMSALSHLNFIKENDVQLKFDYTMPDGGTLLTHWIEKKDAEITKLILQIDPSAIKQIEGKSVFENACLGCQALETAKVLIKHIETENIKLSDFEAWLKRAAKNDCNFKDDEFKSLEPDQKEEIYFAANAFLAWDFVKKLNTLGMKEDPRFNPRRLNFLAANMDIVAARSVISNFLKDLKAQGRLLRLAEFKKLEENKFELKNDNIHLIQADYFIEKIAKENELKHIKVCKKTLVLAREIPTFSIKISLSLALNSILREENILVYAERIKPMNRKLTFTEAIELMTFYQKSGYIGSDFFFTEDGIYFSDTNMMDFSTPDFDAIELIKDFLEPKDIEKFLFEFEKRQEAYEMDSEKRKDQLDQYKKFFEENPNKRLVDAFCEQAFEFQCDTLE
jgi:hypothetical protein